MEARWTVLEPSAPPRAPSSPAPPGGRADSKELLLERLRDALELLEMDTASSVGAGGTGCAPSAHRDPFAAQVGGAWPVTPREQRDGDLSSFTTVPLHDGDAEESVGSSPGGGHTSALQPLPPPPVRRGGGGAAGHAAAATRPRRRSNPLRCFIGGIGGCGAEQQPW
jgi:hypothetical protein